MRYVLSFLALGALAALIVLAPQGLVTKPAYSETAIGPWFMVYAEVGLGDEPEEIRAQLVRELQEAEIPYSTPFVVQPSLDVAQSKSKEGEFVGFMLEVEPWLHTAKAMEFSTMKLDSADVIRADFPYRGTISVALGNWKINERVRRQARKRDYQDQQLIQLFDGDKQQLSYIVPRSALPFEGDH